VRGGYFKNGAMNFTVPHALSYVILQDLRQQFLCLSRRPFAIHPHGFFVEAHCACDTAGQLQNMRVVFMPFVGVEIVRNSTKVLVHGGRGGVP
jgi:hypothetical protein